jgi:hypothetical protein
VGLVTRQIVMEARSQALLDAAQVHFRVAGAHVAIDNVDLNLADPDGGDDRPIGPQSSWVIWLLVEITVVGYSNDPPLQPFYLALGGVITVLGVGWFARTGVPIGGSRATRAQH